MVSAISRLPETRRGFFTSMRYCSPGLTASSFQCATDQQHSRKLQQTYKRTWRSRQAPAAGRRGTSTMSLTASTTPGLPLATIRNSITRGVAVRALPVSRSPRRRRGRPDEQSCLWRPVGAISEAVDIQAGLDCWVGQARLVQRERAAARLAKTQEPSSNVVYGIDFGKGRA